MSLSTKLARAEVSWWIFIDYLVLMTATGIYPPGYEERRRERIKERYGIEIQEPYYKGQSANE